MPDCSDWLGIWFSGQEIDKNCLFEGIKLLWWARIGKVVQFASGLVILADIVGIKRIRKGGKSLHYLVKFSDLQRKFNLGKDLFLSYYKIYPELLTKLKLLFEVNYYMMSGQWQLFSRLQSAVFPKIYINRSTFFFLFIGWWIYVFICLPKIYLLITVMIQAFINNIDLRTPEYIFTAIIFIPLLIFFTLLFPVFAELFWISLIIIGLFLIVIIFLIDNIFIKSLAWLLEQPQLARIIQITSLILFIFGTIIDFMVS